MKTKNHPGKKTLRRRRAEARASRKPQPLGDPTVTDTRFRIGRRRRGVDGFPIVG